MTSTTWVGIGIMAIDMVKIKEFSRTPRMLVIRERIAGSNPVSVAQNLKCGCDGVGIH
ncbi:hypothetical protein KA005_64005 [bacterium]|nr:hypothetical protein [bacterium]